MGGRSLNQSAPDLKEQINQANQGLEKVSIREKTTGCMCGGDTSPPSQGTAPEVATK
jgi:hypothetical protein